MAVTLAKPVAYSLTRIAGKTATAEWVWHPSGALAAVKVELLQDGEVVRAAQFRTSRGAQRVMDNWFKI